VTETSSKHRRFILAAFVLLSLLTAIDIAIYILSDTYRNLLGVVDGQGFGGYLITLFPDILILVFYALFFYQYKRFNTMPKKLLIIHSLVFLVTAILLLIPWIGFFFFAFSPIGVLYFGATLYLPGGYYIALLMAFAFLIFNLYVLVVWNNV
tara:strand:- start:276 stop:731 length:456 start_codon:yes stop_codon:yes gene_type:complete